MSEHLIKNSTTSESTDNSNSLNECSTSSSPIDSSL